MRFALTPRLLSIGIQISPASASKSPAPDDIWSVNEPTFLISSPTRVPWAMGSLPGEHRVPQHPNYVCERRHSAYFFFKVLACHVGSPQPNGIRSS